MATLFWQRDSITGDVNNVKSTFSSWDKCMSEAYCKWPVIVGIIVGSLIALSLLWCVVRILCFGAECCFCCASCMKCCCSCCRSTPSSRRNNQYQQPPPNPYNNYQYQSQPPPMYNQGPQYARFDAPSGKQGYRGASTAGLNDDALPVMPSWGNAQSRKVEDHSIPEDEAVEMGHLHKDAAAEPMLPKVDTAQDAHMYQNPSTSGDLGMMSGAAGGYGDQRGSYGQETGRYAGATSPVSANPYSQQSPYNTSYPSQQHQSPPSTGSGYISPLSSTYQQQTQQPQQQQQYAAYGGARSWQQPQQQQQDSYEPQSPSVYEPSVAAPSYQSRAPSAGQYGGNAAARKPVQGSWRDI